MGMVRCGECGAGWQGRQTVFCQCEASPYLWHWRWKSDGCEHGVRRRVEGAAPEQPTVVIIVGNEPEGAAPALRRIGRRLEVREEER